MNALTKSERTLIDQFVSKNGVTKIPTGKSAFEVEYVWDGYKLVSKEPESVVQRQNRFMQRSRHSRPVDGINAVIRRMFHEGSTDREISDVVQISVEAVKKRRHNMRLARKSPATPDQMAKRLEVILMMQKDGMSQAAIARALGVSHTTVWDALQQHKISGAGK